MKTFLCLICLGALAVQTFAQAKRDRSRAGAADRSITSVAAANAPSSGEPVGISARDGIHVSGSEAFITRNGVSEKLTREMVLLNGLSVAPDGTVAMPNGDHMALRADQNITFSGTIETTQPAAPVAVAPPVARLQDGILRTGNQLLMIRGGRVEKLASDFPMTSGAVVQTNGIVRKQDGTSFILGDGQLLTFNGNILNPGGNPAGNSPAVSMPSVPRALPTESSQATVSGSKVRSPNSPELPGTGAAPR